MGAKPTVVQLILNATTAGKAMLTAANAAAQKTLLSLTKSDVGLSNVDNTADTAKPVSTAQQTALNAKQDTLVSATNIKTINSTSLIGAGDIAIGGIGGSTGSTANRVLTASGTGGATLQACPVEIDSVGRVTASVSAAETITAHTTSGIFVSLSGTVTNNTSNGLRRSAICVQNTSTGAGSFATVRNGVEILSGGATNELCLALITSGNALFIGPATPAVASQSAAALHSVSTLTRQFLFNRSEIGTTATDGTYFSCGSDGTFLIWNQENANLRFGVNNSDSLTLQPTLVRCFTPLLLPAYTVATLPSASTFDGCTVRVTDSNVAASGNYGATAAGGGANKVRVFSNGTNWVIA